MMRMPQQPAGGGAPRLQQQPAPLTMVRICDLRPSVSGTVNTTFIILEKGTRITEGPCAGTSVALVADSTASVHLQLWGPEMELFQAGDIVRLTSGVFSYFKNNMVLRAGHKGLLEKIGYFTMIFVESPNMSNMQWGPDPSNSKSLIPVGVMQSSSSPQGAGHGSLANSRGHH